MTDARTPTAHAASRHAAPLCDGVAGTEMLPVAESRGCQPMVRELTTHIIDALAERGAQLARLEMRAVLESRHCRIPEYHVRQETSARPDWPSGLIGIGGLPLILQAEAYAAR